MLAETTAILDHNHILTVQELWQATKRIETYQEDMAEQTILRLMELDSNTRKSLRLPSLRNPRFEVIAKAIIQIIEDVVSMLAPDLDEFAEELHCVCQLCEKEGIHARLLGEATAAGLAMLLEDFRPEQKQIWQTTFDYLATKMTMVSEFGF